MNLFGLLTVAVLETVVTFLYADPFIAERDVSFLLRVNRDFNDDEELRYETRDAIVQSSFDPTKSTTFLIHGFMEDRSTKHHLALSRAILEKSNQNLFVVDWGKGAKTLDYKLAKQRIVEVAKVVGSFINFLQETEGVEPERVTLIGFSLGAHVSGLAGRNFTTGKLGRIIGLDPAGPLFSVNDEGNRLSTESAFYTECIHTGWTFGIRDPICQVDFYFNGGARQPGCTTFAFDSVICSHYRALEFYIEALMDANSFYGNRCDSSHDAIRQNCDGTAGAYFASPKNEAEKLTGIFHVHTNAESPFGRGLETNR